MVKPSQLFVFFKQAITLNYVLRTTLFTILFLILAAVLINGINIITVIFSDYSISTRLNLISIFIVSAYKVISLRDIFFLVLIALLFGANLELVLQKLNFIRKQPNLGLTIGTGIISIAAAGCASCGLSLISFVGLGSVLALLPFGGVELYVVSVIILLLSFIYNLNALYKACKLN